MTTNQATAVALAAGVFAGVAGAGDLSLPSVLSDHMVLQRDAIVKVWGWAEPHTAVHVEFAGQKLSEQSDRHGAWAVWLDVMPASSEPIGSMWAKGLRVRRPWLSTVSSPNIQALQACAHS